MMADDRKQSIYFTLDMFEEIRSEAERQERSVSWMIQRAWKISKAEIRKIPGVNDPKVDK